MTLVTRLEVPKRSMVHLWRATARAHDPARQILGAYLGEQPQDIRLIRGPRGKPRLYHRKGQPDLRFSVSHSAGVLLVGVTVAKEIGIDLQVWAPGGRSLAGLERFFTSAEQSLLAGERGAARARMRAQLWTAKEAVLKATGTGIDATLKTLDLSGVAGGDSVTVRRPLVGEERLRDWAVMRLDVGSGYAAAVAVEGAAPAVLLREFPQQASG